MAGAPGVQAEYVLNWEYLKQVEKLAQDGIRTAFACTADDFALDIMKYLKEKGCGLRRIMELSGSIM